MKKIFILLFVALALISSCDKEEQEVTTELSEAYVGGVGGISFSFIEGAPISELIAGESSLVSILLKNEGEYDLVKDTIALRLWGLDMGAYGLSSEYKLVGSDLRGIKKGLIEEPGEYVMDMGSLEYQGPVVNSLNTKLRSQICYPYKTKANFNLCVSSNSIQNVESEPACSLNGNKIGSGSVSKAPVKLTKVIEQFEGSNNLVLKLTIENLGMGEVYGFGSVCSELIDANVQRSAEDIVHVTLPEDFICFFMEGVESNEGDIKLGVSGKTLTCYTSVENQGFSYERNIDVSLDYKYSKTDSMDLLILES